MLSHEWSLYKRQLLLLLLLFKTFADLSNINVGGGGEIFKLACLVGKADVVGINEFSARCGWQIIDVQVEEIRCQYRSLWQAILLHLP